MSFSIHLKGGDLRFRDVIYEEPGFILVMPAESSGDFWLLSTQQLEHWTMPKNIPILLEKQNEIRKRLEEWAARNNTFFKIEKAMLKEDVQADYIKKGWIVIDNPDGSWTCSPPK